MTRNWWESVLLLFIISCFLLNGCKTAPGVENSETASQQIPDEKQTEEQSSAEVSQPFIQAGQLVFDMDQHGDDGLGILFFQDSDVEEILINRDSTGEVWCSRTGNGRVLPSSDGNSEADSYIRFNIDDSILYQIPESMEMEIQIEIEYLDEGYDTFRLEYDAHAGGPNGDGTYSPTEMITKTDSGEFKTAVFTLSDAYFGTRIQDNADFRLDDLKDGPETIWRVTVKWKTVDDAEISESAPPNPVEGWAVLAVKEDYTEVGKHSNPTDYIDLGRMRDTLINSGWDPDHILESREFDRDSLQADLDWLEVSADENDVVVLYLSAHSTYLIQNLNWDDFFSEEWEQIPSHKRLLIADLCNGGYFTYPTNNDPNPHLSIASADHDELTWKCEEQEGLPIIGMIFTKYFVDALKDLNYDTDGDGYVSVQEAALIAEEQQRTFMHEYIFSNPDYLKAFENYGNFPNSDPTFPDVILDDTIGEPLYLVLDAYQ